MKRIIVALIFLLATSSVASAQFTPSKENLRGLTGVRLIVMFANCPSRDLSNCAEGLDEALRPEVLRILKTDATAKLQEAGIPLLGLANERNGDPRLILWVTLNKPDNFSYPIVTELQLLQRVRLARDRSIEFDAVTWSQGGKGGAKVEISKIQWLVANHLDRFIKEYLAVNPKQSASSSKDKPRTTRH